ncbi:MAG TPA: hypothetical protein VHO06_08085 [Polyangia bacterium]|nr:hypothetical protein [Polyangia bacterium]
MKSFLSLLLLAGGLAFAVGCGPQKAFCPNAGGDAGGVCPIFGDDAGPMSQDMGGGGNACPTGQHLGDNPDGNPNLTCVCANGTIPPCS